MLKDKESILVTGGCGFIGSAFVRKAVKKYKIIVVDKLTYAGDRKRLEIVEEKYKFYKEDICNRKRMEKIFKKEKPQVLINFAAQTHVDKSIKNPSPFIETNVKGTQVLADLALKFKIKKFVQISTDEVYGETKKGEFKETRPLNPSSPYSASKASADLLIKSYIRTYKLPAIIIRPSNCYGPWQYPEKLIPLAILKLLKNEKVPVYGDGKNIREWLYVEDCAEAILKVLKKGKIGEIYNVGSGEEKRNIDVVRKIIKILGKSESLIEFVPDRPGHDFRYRLNSKKIYEETGFTPKVKFEEGLKKTANWYVKHKKWLLDKGNRL